MQKEEQEPEDSELEKVYRRKNWAFFGKWWVATLKWMTEIIVIIKKGEFCPISSGSLLAPANFSFLAARFFCGSQVQY